MARIPYNGYLEIWLQRVTRPRSVGIDFVSGEPICQIVNGKTPMLWECEWISSNALKTAIDVSKIVVAPAEELSEVMAPEEIELFKQNAWAY